MTNEEEEEPIHGNYESQDSPLKKSFFRYSNNKSKSVNELNTVIPPEGVNLELLELDLSQDFMEKLECKSLWVWKIWNASMWKGKMS